MYAKSIVANPALRVENVLNVNVHHLYPTLVPTNVLYVSVLSESNSAIAVESIISPDSSKLLRSLTNPTLSI